MNQRRLMGLSTLLLPFISTWAFAETTVPPASVSGDTTPVAIIGTTVLTEKQMQDEIAAQLFEAQNQIYQTKKNWIDQKAKQILYTQAAAASGKSLQDWQRSEIDAQVLPPTQAETDKAIHQYFPNGPAPSTTTLQQLTAYLTSQKRTEREKTVYEQLALKTPVTINLVKPVAPVVNVTYSPDDPVLGPKNAPVTIVEFTDFQCPYCKRSQDTLKQVEEAYKGKIKLVARQFPLPMHPRARPAAEAALCAHEQGKFWPYRDKLFPSQSLSDADFEQIGKDVGLNMKKFDACIAAKRFDARIDRDIVDGQRVGVNGTPHFYINGVSLNGAQPFDAFKSAIDDALAAKKS